jgi:flagellar basal body-associated protein FliL
VRLDLSRLPVSNLRSWAVYVAAIAIGLAPGLLVLSTGFIARLLLHVAEMLQPKAEQPPPQKITNPGPFLAKVNANVTDLMEPNGDRVALRHHLHPHSPAEPLTEPAD